MSTTMLYRPGETINPEAWNLPIETTIVADEAVKGALSEGWFLHPNDFPGADAAPAGSPFDHDGDGKPGGSKPRKARAKDEVASNGLTRTEINADLAAMDVEFDPAAGIEDLLALRDLHREERDAK